MIPAPIVSHHPASSIQPHWLPYGVDRQFRSLVVGAASFALCPAPRADGRRGVRRRGYGAPDAASGARVGGSAGRRPAVGMDSRLSRKKRLDWTLRRVTSASAHPIRRMTCQLEPSRNSQIEALDSSPRIAANCSSTCLPSRAVPTMTFERASLSSTQKVEVPKGRVPRM